MAYLFVTTLFVHCISPPASIVSTWIFSCFLCFIWTRWTDRRSPYKGRSAMLPQRSVMCARGCWSLWSDSESSGCFPPDLSRFNSCWRPRTLREREKESITAGPCVLCTRPRKIFLGAVWREAVTEHCSRWQRNTADRRWKIILFEFLILTLFTSLFYYRY